jgi:type VI secretion system protein ImpE
MQPESLFRDGRLEEALEAQLGLVKKNPSDTNARFFLAELAAFQGDWDRVDRQLESVVLQNKNMAVLPLLLRQLIRAEILREQVFQSGSPPEIVVPLTEDCQLQLKVCTSLRLDTADEGMEWLQQADAARGRIVGVCDGVPFDDLIDMDDRLRGVAEVMTATGKYFWVPWSQIESIQFGKPERPMDLIWRKAEISVHDGPEGEVYIPSRYPCIRGWTVQEQLGRATSWHEHPGGLITGRGQRTLLIGDDARAFLELGQIQFQASTL